MTPQLQRCLGLLLACLATVSGASNGPAIVQGVPAQQRFDHAGVDVRLEWASPQGAGRFSARTDLTLALSLTDSATQLPLSGQRARLWASFLTTPEAAQEACTDRTRRLAGGRLSARADLELSGFKLLTLNNDRSVGVLDPQVRVGSTRLETLIQLPADGADWVLLEDAALVAVTLPQQRAVALLDLSSRQLVATIDTGSLGEPRRIVHEPGTSRVWVGLDKADEVVAVDLERREVTRRVTVGGGFHLLEFVRNGAQLLVTSSGSGELAIIEAASGSVRRVATGPATLGVTYSAASLRAYVSTMAGDEVIEVDPAKAEVTRRLKVAPAIHKLRSDPSGRFVFALSERAGRAWVIDTAQGTVVGGADVATQPDQVVFTDRFAYVRGLGSTKISLINLAALREGRIVVSEVPMFRAPANTTPENIQVADMIVRSPDGDGVIVAGTADAVLYSYAEGMMAPQGTFDNARRTPRGVLMLNRGLREVEPGKYKARFRLARPGRYVIPVLVEPTRWLQCVEVHVDGAVPEGERQRVAMIAADPGAVLRPGITAPLRVRLERENGGGPVVGLKDLQFMVLEMPGVWQQRQIAREVEPGVYEIQQRFPRPGEYRLSMATSALGLGFGAKGHLQLRVMPDPAAAAKGS